MATHDPIRRRLIAAAATTPLLTALSAYAETLERPVIEKAIPSSGEKIPVIGIGTSGTFDVGDDAAARKNLADVLAVHRDGGGRVIDTSPMYGTAEAVLGDVLKRSPGNYWIATKVWTTGRDEGIAQMRESMKRMGVDKVDLMQVHNLVDTKTHLATLRDWQQQGTVRYVGVTHYTRSAFAEVERVLRAEKLDFLQINYSLAEREAEERILPLAQERGVAVMANRPFADGAVFDRVRGKPLPPSLREEFLCDSWGQFFLKFIVSHPAVTVAIPATSKVTHASDNLAAGRGELLSAAQRDRMAKAFATI